MPVTPSIREPCDTFSHVSSSRCSATSYATSEEFCSSSSAVVFLVPARLRAFVEPFGVIGTSIVRSTILFVLVAVAASPIVSRAVVLLLHTASSC